MNSSISSKLFSLEVQEGSSLIDPMLLQENKSHQLICWSSVYYKWSRKPAVFGGIKLQVFFSFYFDQVKLDSGYTSLPSLVQQIWRRSGIYAWLSPTNKLTYTLWKPDKNNNIQILAIMNWLFTVEKTTVKFIPWQSQRV